MRQRAKIGREIIKVVSAKEQTLATMERFNPFQTGHGEIKSAKYPSRAKSKASFKKEVKAYV